MGIIIKPLVTEKMTAITDKANNRFGFIVRPEANKLEIKNEVEALYNVTVVDVSTIRYAGKNKSRYTRAGIINGRTNAYKKAIVTLKEGDTIDFYSNIEKKWQYVNLSPQLRGKDIKLLVLSKRLLHEYQKSLLYLVRNLPVVVTIPVK